jgi:hypothetical protein
VGATAMARAVGLIAVVSLCLTAEAANESSADEAYLNALQGSWVMSGTLRGKPVTYSVSGERVLSGAWLRLHMLDASQPPMYRADVFLGYDATTRDYVAHWLDQFGAAGARVVAIGRRQGERLVLMFPYAEGAFRDTFTRDAKDDAWTVLLESQNAHGAWSTFASYELTRPHKP